VPIIVASCWKESRIVQLSGLTLSHKLKLDPLPRLVIRLRGKTRDGIYAR